MSNQSADAGNAAPGHRLTVDGVDYVFRHFGGPELALFQRERFRAERESLRELRDDYPEAEYVRRLDELYARYQRGEFAVDADVDFAEFESEMVREVPYAGRPKKPFIATPEGVLLALRIMTGRSDQENWKALVREPLEVGRLMQLVIAESFPKVPAGANGAPPAAKN